ncbi:MAG: hypothetical protein JJE39_08375 [Vicinamibacteria bacterium]|nr:hypothetical protein [Vicinamibacteria bacterium]
MKTKVAPWIATAALGLVSFQGFAQTPAPAPVLGQVESVDATARTFSVRLDDGSALVAALAEKARLLKVAPGEKSLQNAAPIEFGVVTPGDRVLIRGGSRSDGRIDGVLQIVVMAKTDLAARNEAEQRAWRERAVVGTVTAVDAPSGQFTIRVSSSSSASAAPPTPAGAAATAEVSMVIDAKRATLHRYSDTSAKFEDAKPAQVQDIAEGDQLRLLGTQSADGSTMNADRVVFGSFKTRALAIERMDIATGTLNVKDLESNEKFALTIAAGGAIRRIPAEMGAMLTMMAGGGARPGGPPRDGGAPTMGNERPEGGSGRPDRGAPGTGAPSAGMGGRGPGAGGPRGNRGMQGVVERMPTITLAELKKDDWVGAVVGKIDASGRAIAFNMLAGIEIFASRANRRGGVDVGMPAGLLDGAMDVP